MQKDYIYGETATLLDKVFPKEAYWATWIFFSAIAVVVLLGAFPELRPMLGPVGKAKSLSMNLVIQMMMLTAGAIILMTCKVKPQEIPNGTVFKAGMVAVVSIFGVAWMADTVFEANFTLLKNSLAGVVSFPIPGPMRWFCSSPRSWSNSQAAAIAAIAPIAVSLGVDPKIMMAFLPACYGYFILPTYASDLACIGFDRSGTATHRQVRHQPQLHHPRPARRGYGLRSGLADRQDVLLSNTQQQKSRPRAAFSFTGPHSADRRQATSAQRCAA